MVYTGPMMNDGGGIPADLEKDATSAAASSGSTSANSYTKTIRMIPVKDKTYKFFFTYLHEDSETKLITESERSPAYLVKHVIENGTLPVEGLTLTPGFKCYGVKFTINPLSTQDDVVIFESLTSDFAVQNIVYVGTSTNVTIQASSYAPRWIKVRSRDRWDDFNISEVTAGPVTPLNSEIDTTKVPKAPTGVGVTPSIDPEDKSGFSIKIDVSWTASTDADTNGYVIRWSPNNPATVTNPLWEYGQVDGKEATKFSITGLTPNTVYYWQVTAKSPFNSISWNTGIAGQVASGSFGPVSDPNAPEGNVQLRSILSIGGKTADLFKIGTGIAQSINTSTTITPTQTAGTYNGIILDRSTTNFGHNYWLNTGQFRVGSASSFLYWDGSDIYTTGKINATGGTFTGNLRVTTGSIIAGGTFAADGSVSGARVVMQSGGLYAHDAAGAQSVFIQASDGLIDARKGFVGGWTINATSQTDGYIQSSNTKIESSGNITLGDTTATLPSIVKLSGSDPDYRLWVGSQVAANANFRVSKEGILYAAGAIIGGYPTTSAASADAQARADAAKAAAIAAAATDATTKANTAKARADLAYDKAVAAAEGTTLAQQRAQEAVDAVALKIAATDVQAAITNNVTVIDGAKITTGQIDVARLNITGGNTTNGFAIDGNGIRGYSGGSQNLSISSSGVISMKGAITATSGKIAGFEISGASDLYADTAVGPRILFQSSNSTIMHFGWESGSFSTGTYAFIAGQDTTVAGSSFYVNTKTKTFRFAADSSQRSYAAEIRNDIRARDYRYIAGGGLVNDTSSRRFKENITYAPKTYYDRVLDINPAFYTYKHNHPETDSSVWGQHGFGPIVEDLEDAGLGLFVQRNLNGEPTSLKNEQKIPMLLIPIVRELKEKVEAMEQKILELEAR
jgi:hypothetical protein